MRRRRPEKREILSDPVYSSLMVAKFINYIMVDGKKGVAEKSFTEQWSRLEIRRRLMA